MPVTNRRRIGIGGLGCGGLAIGGLFLVGLVGAILATADPAPFPTAVTEPVANPSTALGVLATVEVKERGSKTGYDRDSFGWRRDTDHNGCDTRNDVLRRDLTAVTLEEGTHGCVVLRGTLTSPFSGDVIAFDRQDGDVDSDVDIDHVVALSDAWQSGAHEWDEQTRIAFANDPLNLMAVEGSLNSQKGDGDAATWLPPSTGYRCPYVTRQVAVKAKYGLWMKPAEAEAIQRVLEDCPDQPALTDDADWPAAGQGDVIGTEPAIAPAPTPAPAGRRL